MKKKRVTRETEIEVSVERGPRREPRIDTTLAFFNHMLETIAWRSCMNIDASVKVKTYRLAHTITEDTGITLGRCLREMLENEMKKGINGYGSSVAVIDEALARVTVSVEGRANTFVEIQCEGGKLERVEDMLSADLAAFLEGLSQGFGATIRAELIYGRDPHHTWESVFRALGESLKKVFERNEWRAGTTVGVKGTLE
jgi:imidazoleglycerol-phosphate dehydratase